MKSSYRSFTDRYLLYS